MINFKTFFVQNFIADIVNVFLNSRVLKKSYNSFAIGDYWNQCFMVTYLLIQNENK